MSRTDVSFVSSGGEPRQLLDVPSQLAFLAQHVPVKN